MCNTKTSSISNVDMKSKIEEFQIVINSSNGENKVDLSITSIESENTTTEKKNCRTWYLWTYIKFKTIKSTIVSEIRNQYTNQIKEVYPNTKTAKLGNKVHSKHLLKKI